MRRLRVLVLRPERQADDLARKLEDRGAEPVVVPAIRILAPRDWGPADQAIDHLGEFDWLVFTSVNGVDSFFDRISQRGVSPHPLPARIGAVGPKTREALEQRGISVNWVPTRYTTSAMADEFPDPGCRALLVRSESAGGELDHALAARGLDVTRVDAYRSEPEDAEPLARALESGIDAIAFTSASIVDAFVEAAGADARGAIVCSIGPATSEACRRWGFDIDVEAPEHTSAGLVRAIFDYLDQRAKQNAAT